MTDEKQVRQHDKFLIRLPDGMRDRIAAEAKANKRTMNAEVVARLEASFAPPAVGDGMVLLPRKNVEDLLAQSADLIEALRAKGIIPGAKDTLT